MNLDFISFSFLDVLDIFLVAILLYYAYKLLKGTVAINIVIGITFIFLIWKITQNLHMEMLSGILGYLLSGGVIALIIVFQQEIRKFLLMIGSTNFSSKRNFLKQLRFLKSEINVNTDIDTLMHASKSLAQTKTGALIVIERTNSLDFLINSGDSMNALINEAIIQSIFYKNSPLHDGATIIRDNYIVATRVILPISESTKIPARFGLRHRAAIGVTEKTDAVCLLVSEETGEISYIKDGEFIFYKTIEELTEKLHTDLTE
ncbi:diadenylate cyclase CdaA [Tenacibaculum maritimum]|uniref:Diadenylate cyclase n=1 Tax=Tenacibaculum maritimum NCIMB 2154 TaxID=1349785 RepID=A0A2H1E7G3_9FLAO|nr:diadenylate cyclase CdaA [Tenacibaculum maritimum]MCD9562049.1 diadenylate cyclase CdaA [Tenacibaculum maritimum]MCD9565131.1 diadenylate cyclase CdaA [Tenacibaculum maritimum]MCD9579105.1 diadenylate cyclase CdaA [Tenacibaculum maritimum]MCD9583923.1 diadenylate cyclase CdaA [Tenacibaculum maritimum]MCD9595959.1 diadenylate cyclase CdaA [Tenacibaculum maritimum]